MSSRGRRRLLSAGLSQSLKRWSTIKSSAASSPRRKRFAVAARLEDSDATGINGDQGNSNAPYSGAAYLFTSHGGSWTQTAYLKASNANAGAQFGDALALSGSSLAVGAWFEANSAPKSGAVYVFDGL